MNFEREERYIVVKIKDLSASQAAALCRTLTHNDIHTRECVVVEPDWPIYEQTWDAIRRLSQGMEQEADALRARLREVEAERDALAAHAEKGAKIIDQWGEHEVSDCDAALALADWRSEPIPTTSLARRDAELLNRPFEGLPGCTDGGCVVKKPEGMHTNGGCQCIKHQTASTIVQRLARLRDQFRQQAEGGGDE